MHAVREIQKLGGILGFEYLVRCCGWRNFIHKTHSSYI